MSWRVGRVYKDRIIEDGKQIGFMDTPEQAARIVALLNDGEADKRRLDWLEQNHGIYIDRDEGGPYQWTACDTNAVDLATGKTPREAIDRASADASGRTK